MELKPMKYLTYEETRRPDWERRKEDVEILFSNTYKGFTYHILNMFGLHMCAYLEVDDNVEELILDMDCYLGIHGGVSYRDMHPIFKEYCVGWDYAHLGDWRPIFSFDDSSLHKWTSPEVDAECRQVIDNIVKALEEESN